MRNVPFRTPYVNANQKVDKYFADVDLHVLAVQDAECCSGKRDYHQIGDNSHQSVRLAFVLKEHQTRCCSPAN